MARETLDTKVKLLNEGILIMDSMVELATAGAVEAFKKHDLAAARLIYDADRQLNRKRFEIERDLIITIATTQPIMASDLRKVASIYEIASELERMGDYAKGIAKIALMSGEMHQQTSFPDISKMAEISIRMLHDAIGAFLAGDVEKARNIPAQDDEVDFLYNKIYRNLIATVIAIPDAFDSVNHLLWAAHNLERLADRVTNICERTIYNVTGDLVELDNSDGEVNVSDAF